MIEGIPYQQAYVTDDLARAVDTLRAAGDVRTVIEFEGTSQVTTPAGPTAITCAFALVWIEDVQYELIAPLSDPQGMYTSSLPGEGQLLRFHHTALRVPDWDSFRARVDDQPFPVAMERDTGELRFLYLDTRPLLGHYVEYVATSDEMWARTGGR